MKTITLDTLKAMNAGTFSVQDNSPRGVKTVTAEEIKPGDRVVIDNHFCEVVAAIDGEDAPGRDVLGQVREYLRCTRGITAALIPATTSQHATLTASSAAAW